MAFKKIIILFMVNFVNLNTLTILKIVFIFIFISLNILFILFTDLSAKPNIKQSGMGAAGRGLSNTAKFLVSSSTLYGTFLAYKNDRYNAKRLENLDQENADIKAQFEEAKQEISNLKDQNTLIKKEYSDIIHTAYQNNHQQFDYIIKKEQYEAEFAKVEKEIKDTPSDATKNLEAQQKLTNLQSQQKTFIDQEKEIVEKHEKLEKIINEKERSNFITLDYSFNDLLENFSLIEKISVCFLILNQIIVSSLISIVLLVYGDYLIKRFQLETRYPKLATLIKYRKKFQKYYLYLNLGFILGAFLVENIFLISILLTHFS